MSLVRHLVEHGAAAARGRRLPFALTYHGIGDEDVAEDPHGLMMPPARFAAQLDALLDAGYRLVGVTELWTAVSRGGRAADGLGAITLDDGLAASMHAAAEICAPRGVTPTLFLAPGLFGRDHPDLRAGHRILRPEEVPLLERAGCEIGAHSQEHVKLPLITPSARLHELRRSRAVLEELLEHPVLTMSYPFGRHDAATRSAAAQAGYTVACANDGAGSWRALALPREPVFPATTLTRLRIKAAGLYAPVHALKSAGARRRLPT